MSILIYTADFREKDGEVLVAADVDSNFSDVELAANSLDWRNIRSGSLDTYHMAVGEAAKAAEGGMRKHRPVNPGWLDLASFSVEVGAGDGVYAVGSVSYDGTRAGFQNPPSAPVVFAAGAASNPSTIKIHSSHQPAAGAGTPVGHRLHSMADNPEVHGQAGIVFAYQVDENTVSIGGSHVVSLAISLDSGLAVASSHEHVHGNFTVFVIHR